MEQNMNFDNEVLAYLSTRKDELMTQHDEYIVEHPEIREVLNDFLSSVLLNKPVSAPSKVLFQMSNHLAVYLLGRRVRIRQGILPPIQSNSSAEQTTYPGWPIWCR